MRGLALVSSSQNICFYDAFIDDHSLFTWLYPFKRKLDFFTCFIQFQNMVENQFNRKINVFQCDGGGEFNSNIFRLIFKIVALRYKCLVQAHMSKTKYQNQTSTHC